MCMWVDGGERHTARQGGRGGAGFGRSGVEMRPPADRSRGGRAMRDGRCGCCAGIAVEE